MLFFLMALVSIFTPNSSAGTACTRGEPTNTQRSGTRKSFFTTSRSSMLLATTLALCGGHMFRHRRSIAMTHSLFSQTRSGWSTCGTSNDRQKDCIVLRASTSHKLADLGFATSFLKVCFQILGLCFISTVNQIPSSQKDPNQQRIP